MVCYLILLIGLVAVFAHFMMLDLCVLDVCCGAFALYCDCVVVVWFVDEGGFVGDYVLFTVIVYVVC